MSTFCSIIRCNEEYDTIVGTSASCVSRTAVRGGMRSMKILGTSITCMSVSKKCMMSGNCSTICGTGRSRIWTMGATAHGDAQAFVLWLLFLTRTEESQAVYGHKSLKFIVQGPRWQSTLHHRGLRKIPLNGSAHWRSAKNAVVHGENPDQRPLPSSTPHPQLRSSKVVVITQNFIIVIKWRA